MKCLLVSFEVSMGLMRLLVACILMLWVMFLHYWRIRIRNKTKLQKLLKNMKYALKIGSFVFQGSSRF